MTVTKCVFADGARPAPETPDFASTTTSFDGPAAGERGEREQRRGRIAAGVGDEVGGRDLVAVDLGQAVHAAAEQLGRAVLAVPALVGRLVAQAEVGGQVDHAHAALAQLRDDGRGGAVRIGDDRGLDVAVRVDVELLEDRIHAVVRVQLATAGGRRRCGS